MPNMHKFKYIYLEVQAKNQIRNLRFQVKYIVLNAFNQVYEILS